MKNTFLANMSHEIRTPLNAIVGFSGILATGDPSPNVRQKCAENIKSSSSLLLRLINDILDLSRLEAEKMAFTWEEHDIVLIMRRAISIMEQAATNGNRYVFRPVRHSLMLFTDEQRIQQVFINLLTNAAKFTKSGTITADFSIDDADGMVEFFVTDTGCGIPPEMSEVIFERFEKLDSFVQGTGLGLSICRQIVSKWGGTIRLDTNYSAGARFVFTHPLKIRTGDGSTQ
jgi:signal transduction histidine kinase